MRIRIGITLLFFTLFACKNDKKDIPSVENIKINFNYVPLEKELFKFKSEEDAKLFLQKHPRFTKIYLEANPDSLDPGFVQNFHQFYTNKFLYEFYLETENSFKGFDLKSSLEDLFRRTTYYYKDFYTPEVNTLISGFRFNKDIVVSDSLVAISVDYFIGKNAKYRPDAYGYFLDRYEKEYIVPMTAMALSDKFNKVNLKDETLLAHMIYYGKAHYFMEKVMPTVPDSLIIMYSGKQLKDASENLDIIWAHFIEKKLLFETRPKTIEKYVGESPKISEIGENCPGRIGRWLGWQIVRKYMKENPKVTFQQLMEEQDAGKIFNMSKYKPEL